MKLLLSHILIYLWKFGTGAFIDAGLVTVEETESWACQKMTRQSLSFVMLNFWSLSFQIWKQISGDLTLHKSLRIHSCTFFGNFYFWEKLFLQKGSPIKYVQPKLSIPISPVQLKSAPSIPRLFLMFWFKIFW